MEGQTMKKISFLFMWLASLLVAGLLVGCGVASGQPSAVSTVDPFVALANEQATNQASEQKIELLSSQLTATAEAPIVAMTQTAADFAMLKQYAEATSQAGLMTQTAAMTQTAQSWTPTVVPTNTANLTSTMAVLELSATAQSMENAVARERSTNTVRAIGTYAVALVLLIVVVMFALAGAFRISKIQSKTDERGKVMPLLDVVNGVVVDVDRLANGAAQMTPTYLKQLPVVTPERQADVTNRAQLVDMYTRRNSSSAMKQLMANQQQVLPKPHSTMSEIESKLFPLPSWDIANGWQKEKDLIPCGNSGNGLEYWNLQQHPHLAIFGMSGSGKSRRGLRPLVTFMLASNQRVILIGKEIDFLPFIGHPNVVFIPVYDLTERAEALKYAEALAACVEEKNRRIRYMAQRGVSLWEHERTNIVLDELGNALIEMPDDLEASTMNKARSLVNEGRKAGMSLVFSAQRPKGFVDLTTQCGRFVFFVETDQERGYALGMKGADRLPEVPVGYFYKKTASLQLTGAFEPTDDEIRAYLRGSYEKPLSKAEWIEGLVKGGEQSQLAVNNEARSLPEVNEAVSSQQSAVSHQRKAESRKPEFDAEIIKKAEELRPQWHPKMSKSAIARMLWNRAYGGDLVMKVEQVLGYLSTTTSSTTEKVSEMPNFEAITA